MLTAIMNTGFKVKAQSVYRHINRLCGGAPAILVDTVRSFAEVNGAESAASIAYYALFSLFPLLIFLIGFVSSLLENEPVQQLVLEAVEKFLPTAQELVKENIERALSIRGTVQLVGTIVLLWAATGVFNALGHSINRAWHTAEERNFVFGRLIALAMVAGLTGLLILWVFLTTAFSLFPWFEIPIFGDVVIYNTYAWSIMSQVIPFLVIFALFLNLYRWVPNTRVRWLEALWGAVIAALGWELVNSAYSWYLTSGFARYHIIYGSLGALIGLMLWIYLSSVIVLFGAHLSATIAMHTRLKADKPY